MLLDQGYGQPAQLWNWSPLHPGFPLLALSHSLSPSLLLFKLRYNSYNIKFTILSIQRLCHLAILSHYISSNLPPSLYSGSVQYHPSAKASLTGLCITDQPCRPPALPLTNLTPDMASTCQSIVCLPWLEGKFHEDRASVLSTALSTTRNSARHTVGTSKYLLTILFGSQGENHPAGSLQVGRANPERQLIHRTPWCT